MRGNPIHENLSTAFVDLTALVRHLRGLQFVGSVRLEFASYEAEIFFTPTKRIQAREYDRLAGRIAQGERALERSANCSTSRSLGRTESELPTLYTPTDRR
jgi:hypothetical protein